MSAPPAGGEDARVRVVEALRNVLDPELGVNVLDLGLVYDVAVDGSGVRIDITMTSAACPLGDVLIGDVQRTVTRLVPEAGEVTVRLVWQPPWTPQRMSEAARRQLGW